MRLTIKNRLWLGLSVMMVLIVGATSLAYVLAERTSATTHRMMDVEVERQAAAQHAAVAMLQARRSEKDFLMRRDRKYLDRVDEAVATVEKEIQIIQQLSSDKAEAEKTIALANEYHRLFHEVADQVEEKGLTEKDGLQGELRAAVHAVEQSLKDAGHDELTVLMLMCRRHEKDYLLRGDPKYLGRIAQRIEEFDAAAQRLGIDEARRQQWQSLFENYYNGVAAIVAADEQIAELTSAFRQATHETEAMLAKVVEDAESRVAADHDIVNQHLDRTQLASLILLVVGLCVGIPTAWLTSRSILRPLATITERFEDIAAGEGDLTKRITISSRDELGHLATQFNLFVEKIQEVMIQVAAAANEVASSSTQIAASSEEISSSVEQQKNDATQISSAIEEMSASVVEVARKSAEAASNADDAGKQAKHGGEVVEQTITGIDAIAQVVREASDVIGTLGKRGDQIGQIVEVINDIADQTNLLALNAAIEAARAGEHGRGFAVVADEVRKLADRTTKATEEIVESIGAIQTDTSTAVTRIDAGTEKVTEGVAMARQANEALQGIVGGSAEVAGMIGSIAAAAKQQSAASEQISRNIESISNSTQQNAEGVAQAAEAAADLSRKAEQLQVLVGRFTLHNDGGDPSTIRAEAA